MVFLTDVPLTLGLNEDSSTTLHLDINSCFATLEQQANPLLRGVPLAVAAYNQPFGCILAASREAKLWGVKTGMRVSEGRQLCPLLVVTEGDPDKYRFVHEQLRNILDEYTDKVEAKSIDEFVLDFASSRERHNLAPVVQEIKNRIQAEIGEWITVSVGVGPSRFLAKLGADIDKPDGYQHISHHNLLSVYDRIDLRTFCGINYRLEARLNAQDIFTPRQFLESSLTRLRAAFRSVLARDWYLRLRGYEVDDFGFARRSYGQSYVLPRSSEESAWLPILAKLVEKATRRMREDGYGCYGVSLYLSFGKEGSWHSRHQGKVFSFTTADCLRLARDVLERCQRRKAVKQIAVAFFALAPLSSLQLSFGADLPRLRELSRAVDQVNNRYGSYTLTTAAMLGTDRFVPDRIAFGK